MAKSTMTKRSAPKRKTRRFDDGGLTEAANKEAGLKASSGEKVGFFERLRMGNIDDPSSEAYKRFGAGRGRAEQVPVETRTPMSAIRDADDQYNPDVKQMDALELANTREPIDMGVGPRATSSGASSAAKPAAKYKAPQAKSAADRAANRDSYVPLTRTIPSRESYQKVPAKSAPQRSEEPRKSPRAGTAADIPGSSPEGWRGGSGERVNSTEAGRNASAFMNALGPGRLVTGLTLAAREAAMIPAAQRAYNARAAARRAAEGLSPAEAAAAKEAIREAKTLNPNAWLAGPKGMAENFKRGGSVKKMSGGGMTSKPAASSASRRGDGIASKGKTRGRMC